MIVREDDPGGKQLVAYVVAPAGVSLDRAALRRELAARLPDYMVPSAIVVLDKLPLTPSGKLDRKTLPAPEQQAETYRPPRTPQEQILCELIGEVLSVDDVGIDDNFFELGGQSLLAMRPASRVRTALGMELAIRAMFEAPTVAQLAARLQGSEAARPPLVRQPRPERLPLSAAQSRLWFIDRLEGTSTEYNIPEALRLRGALDHPALERTLKAIVERHEGLRTHFVEMDSEPAQVIVPELQIDVPLEDLSALDEGAAQAEIARAVRREWNEPFDLSRGPLLRMKLLRLGEEDHVLLRTCHHIVTDAWSRGVFNREFAELYTAFRAGRENPLAPLPVQYADFALWQRAWFDGEALQRGLDYWKAQLAGIPQRLELATDQPRPAMQTYAAAICEVTLPPQAVAEVRRLCRESQATMYMTLLSAFAALLQRYCRQDDIVVGSPIANRQEPSLEHLIGFFVNALVMRLRVKSGSSFRALLVEVRRTAVEAYQHQDVPFERLVQELQPERSLSYTPVFQVMFALQNAPSAKTCLEGLAIEPVAGKELRVRCDLEVHAVEHNGEIKLSWIYNRDLFDHWRVAQMARHYVELLEAALASPDVPLHQLEILSPEERYTLLEEFNDTARLIPETTLPALFEAQVARAHAALAVVCEGESLTYGELNARANRLAHHLIRLDVGPEKLVGICLERSVEMVVAILATLKAGGAYLPLDPEYPEARLAQMVLDAGPALVLTSGAARNRLPAAVDVLCLDSCDAHEALRQGSADDPTDGDRTYPVRMQHPAYVIYTSGSTGAPKGVVVSHRSLTSLSAWAKSEFGREGLSGVLASTSICFDLSVFELLVTLSLGGEVILADTVMHLENLSGLDRVRLINTVPSGATVLLDIRGLPQGVRTINLAGESVRNSLVQRFYRCPGVERVLNLYGPTECTVYSTATVCPRSSDLEPAIGRPVSNARAYVLDSGLQPVPVGVSGEMYIAGPSLRAAI